MPSEKKDRSKLNSFSNNYTICFDSLSIAERCDNYEYLRTCYNSLKTNDNGIQMFIELK